MQRIDEKLTKLLPERFELIEVRLVLLLVLNLLLDTFENPDRGCVVVDAACSPDGSLDDSRCGHEIMRKAVVEAALNLKEILSRLEEVDVTLGEGLERLLSVCAGGRAGEGGSNASRSGASAEEGGRKLSTEHGGELGGDGGGRPCGEGLVVVVKKRRTGVELEGTTRRGSAEAQFHHASRFSPTRDRSAQSIVDVTVVAHCSTNKISASTVCYSYAHNCLYRSRHRIVARRAQGRTCKNPDWASVGRSSECGRVWACGAS